MPRAPHTSTDPMRGPRACVATARNGKPCKGQPILGGRVCRMHGGAAPQVKQAAAERLAALVDPAITTLEALLWAEYEPTRLGAAKDILDRNGFKPTEKIDLSARVTYSQLSDDDLNAQIAAFETRTRTVSRAAQRAKAPPVSD